MTTPRRTDTHAPHRARVRALRILHTAEVRQEDPRVTLDRWLARPQDIDSLDADDLEDLDVPDDARAAWESIRGSAGGAIDAFTRALVRGVAADTPILDARLDATAEHWDVERMSTIDRNILRLAAWELLNEDTPNAVVIDEAVELANEHSGPEGPKFVNGVAAALVELPKPTEADIQKAREEADKAAAARKERLEAERTAKEAAHAKKVEEDLAALAVQRAEIEAERAAKKAEREAKRQADSSAEKSRIKPEPAPMPRPTVGPEAAPADEPAPQSAAPEPPAPSDEEPVVAEQMTLDAPAADDTSSA